MSEDIEIKVKKIFGVILHYPIPVIDGFRLVYRNGVIKEIPYTLIKYDVKWLYLFKPPITLKGNEEASLQYRIKPSVPIPDTAQIEIIVEPLPEFEKIKWQLPNGEVLFSSEKETLGDVDG